MVRIFLRILSKIIGLRFSGGPLGFPGFCMGYRRPCTSAFGISPVVAVELYISAICLWIDIGAYLINSACSLSGPAALSLFSFLCDILYFFWCEVILHAAWGHF